MSMQERAIARVEGGKWAKGQSGNPGGRPFGTKVALQKRFLEDLTAVWEERGVEAINAVIDDKPEKFLELVASLLPTEATLHVNNSTELTPDAERLSSNLEWIRSHIERARENRTAEVSESGRPLLPAPVHAEKDGH